MKAAMGKAGEAAQAKMESAGKENKAKGEIPHREQGQAGRENHRKRPAVPGRQRGKRQDAQPTDTVKVHYRGTLIDGTQFDSSYDRNEPAEFPLNGVIKGWTEGLQLMKVGGKMKLFVPSDLAYGPQGRPSIPPSSVLIFDIELLEIVAAK